MLSGGVDSALLVSVMSSLRSIEGLNTFAVGYERDRGDLRWARQVAQDLGVEHRELTLGRSEYLELLDDAVVALQAPLTFGNEPALLGLCRLAREHVTVVLGGEGADEAFGGYRKLFGAVPWRQRVQGFNRGLVDQRGRQALQESFGLLPPRVRRFFLNLYHWFHFPTELPARDELKAHHNDSALFAHVDRLFVGAGVGRFEHAGRLLKASGAACAARP